MRLLLRPPNNQSRTFLAFKIKREEIIEGWVFKAVQEATRRQARRGTKTKPVEAEPNQRYLPPPPPPRPKAKLTIPETIRIIKAVRKFQSKGECALKPRNDSNGALLTKPAGLPTEVSFSCDDTNISGITSTANSDQSSSGIEANGSNSCHNKSIIFKASSTSKSGHKGTKSKEAKGKCFVPPSRSDHMKATKRRLLLAKNSRAASSSITSHTVKTTLSSFSSCLADDEINETVVIL